MTQTVLIEVPAEHEILVRRMLAWSEEMIQLGQTAPDGAVIEECENAVVKRGREIQQQVLQMSVARRIETAEKRGPRFVDVPVVGPKKIEAPKRVN